MKKLICYSIVLTMIIVTLMSCKDILTENPKSFVSPEGFPTTEREAIAATNAAYSRLYGGPRDLYVRFVSSDIAFQGFHNKRPVTYFQGLDQFDGDANTIWDGGYEGITEANFAINAVPNVDMNPDLRNRLVAEAKVLRAWYYFWLVRLYGPLPIVEEPVSSPSDVEDITRSSVDQVYTLIKNDLTEAIPDLPSSYPDEQLGRVTRWAAIGLLGKVHLTLEEWDQAIQQLDLVINSGQYGLIENYNNLFGTLNENQRFPNEDGTLVMEDIWSAQFARDERGNTLTQQTGSRDPEIGGNTNHYGGFENMLPTPAYRDMFELGDERVEISYVTEVEGNVLESPRTPGAGPINAKYQNPNAEPPEPFNGGNNVYILRYADVLLMRAEAENELNGPANAYQYINQVRARAEVPDLSGLTQEEFRQAVRKERATELGFEGHRRLDLLRWGIYVETIRNTTSPFLEIPRNSIQDFHVLLPIPNNEVQVSNGSIEQNSGY